MSTTTPRRHRRSSGSVAAGEGERHQRKSSSSSSSSSSSRSSSSSLQLPSPAIAPRIRHGQHQEQSKTIYFVRHGQSIANTVSSQEARQTDPALLDCGLTALGVQQARHVPHLLGEQAVASIQRVLTSPLTRAIATALLAFPNHPILVHYDLGEFGGGRVGGNGGGEKIVGTTDATQSPHKGLRRIVPPENHPRPIEQVVVDVARVAGLDVHEVCRRVDFASLMPTGWPSSRHVDVPSLVKAERVRTFVTNFLPSRPETVVAVVAHFNVIRAAMSVTPDLGAGAGAGATPPRGTMASASASDSRRSSRSGHVVRPRNAVPIPCLLTPSGFRWPPDVGVDAASPSSRLPRPVALVSQLEDELGDVTMADAPLATWTEDVTMTDAALEAIQEL